jgi:hypothetical protein
VDPAEILARRVRALALRRGGASYREIAGHLGVSLNTAYEDVQAELCVLDEQRKALAEETRALELARLDDMTKTATTQFRNGSVKAGEVLIRVMERRARLLGLDSPLKVAPTTPDGSQPLPGTPLLDVSTLSPDERAVLRRIAERGAAAESASRP